MTRHAKLSRRTLLQAGWAAAAAPIWARLAGAEPASDREHLLERLADLVIPATGTPGAVAVGVPDFVVLALEHGLEDTGAGLAVLDAVAADLDRRAGGSYLAAAPERQATLLAALDAESYGPDGSRAPWRKLKGLIVTGYYTSEIGASKELRYELVPGRFDPDLPKAASDRSWSSDWTAVDFG